MMKVDPQNATVAGGIALLAALAFTWVSGNENGRDDEVSRVNQSFLGDEPILGNWKIYANCGLFDQSGFEWAGERKSPRVEFDAEKSDLDEVTLYFPETKFDAAQKPPESIKERFQALKELACLQEPEDRGEDDKIEATRYQLYLQEDGKVEVSKSRVRAGNWLLAPEDEKSFSYDVIVPIKPTTNNEKKVDKLVSKVFFPNNKGTTERERG